MVDTRLGEGGQASETVSFFFSHHETRTTAKKEKQHEVTGDEAWKENPQKQNIGLGRRTQLCIYAWVLHGHPVPSAISVLCTLDLEHVRSRHKPVSE